MAEALTPEAAAVAATTELKWRLLKLLNAFRALAAAMLLMLFLVDEPPRMVGGMASGAFLLTISVYLAAAVAFAVAIGQRLVRAEHQALVQLVVDVVAVGLLLHSSGGVTSGLATLLIVCVMAASLLLSAQLAILYAAIASLALLLEQTSVFLANGNQSGWTHVAVLGAIFFAIAVIGTRLARSAYESEALARRRGADLADLAQVNDSVLQHLQTGVAVVADDGRITQLNATAATFLGVTGPARGRAVAECAPRLAALVDAWRREPGRQPASFPAADDGRAIVPHLKAVGVTGRRALLVFLEDPRLGAERIQDLKLAALGRLTASIAHEIRNPLAALSHAHQLLEESPRLDAEERRFAGIIGTNVARMDAIVESVLALGRPASARPDPIELAGLLRDTIAEFTSSSGTRVRYAPATDDVQARVDPTQLHQTVTNLLENARKHGGPGIEVRCGKLDDGAAFVEVEDDGPGVPPELVQHIFEPFYSGSPRGTGLGLFIARELLAAHGATLSYAPRAAGGACFRIAFPEPGRWVS